MQHPKLLIGSVLLLIALAASLVLLWPTPIVQNVLANAKITSQAEPFSELYFVDHLHLPTQAVAGEFNFAFTVVSKERGTKAYPYKVLLTVDGKTTVIDSGTFNLGVGASRSVKEKFELNGQPTGAELTVQLVGENQEIHFWMRKQS